MEHTYELKHPFEYARKGETQEASFVTMTAPTFNEIDKVAPIKQAFMTAIADLAGDQVAQASDEADSEAEIDGKQVIQLLYGSKGSVVSIFKHAEKLFKSGVAQLDGDTPLNGVLLGKMSMADFEGMVGDYIANFIMPSLTDGL